MKTLLAVLSFLALLSVFMAVPACTYCDVAANKTTPVCKVAAVASQCGEKAIVQLVLQYLPQVVIALISDDYVPLLAALEAQIGPTGQTVVTCATQVADQNATSPTTPTTLAPLLVTIHNHAAARLAAHKLSSRDTSWMTESMRLSFLDTLGLARVLQ